MLIGPVPLPQLAPHPGVTGLAIGVFDGVHLGHQAVVRSLEGKVAALTFEPHPLAVIAPDRVPPRLTTLEQKVAYMRAQGTVAVIAVKFDAALRELSPAAFVDEIARVFPDLKHVAIGESWSFGRNREGNAARLAELAQRHGFTVKAIAPVQIDGAAVSSTRIREAILQRRFDEAARLLGRSYAVTGKVIHGEERGRTLGFPTANLADVDQLLPPRGVYAVRARVAGNLTKYHAVMNLGRRPTFTSNGIDSLEVHILDFHADLYGEKLWVSDMAWLRDETAFPTADALKAQIAQDVARAKALL
ncbi:MAG TPA: riboflavin biosynthesis protein RibF [Candidatus Methylacidiphilales bacterium]|jgi:riboflavin kinase/FMN adenylyltransferase|nr:riboflavin biosynthesis protein RibF [Candidatus Methylacidiphilales bacterium]